MKRLSGFWLAILLALSLALPGALQAAGLEAQASREGDVTVKVTPGNIVPKAEYWDFEVSITTHAVPLNHDMARAAILVADAGMPQTPLAWKGDPPGGHHRKGVLRFQPPPVWPRLLELRIRGIGGASERVFRWQLAE